MSRIKTREKANGIKVLDKSAIASERMRSAAVRTKQNASALVDHDASSENEYASDSAQNLADNTIHDAGDLAVNSSKTAMRNGRELVEKRIKTRAEPRKEYPENAEQSTQPPNTHAKSASSQPDIQPQKSVDEKPFEQGRELAKKQAVEKRAERTRRQSNPQQPEIARAEQGKYKKAISHRERTIKTVERSDHTIKQAGKTTVKATGKSAQAAIKNTERTVKTAEQTSKMTVKTARATAKAAQQSAVASAKAARTAAAAAKAAAKAAAEAAKVAANAVATAVKAIAAAVKALVAAIAAGGWAAVLVIVIVVLIVAVIASPFGIFFSGESADTESVPAAVAIAQINYDFNSRLEAMQDGDYDDIVLEGTPADWIDVLAVFAVKVAGAEDASATYVAALDAERVQKLKDVFYDMTTLWSYVETINHPDSSPDDDIDDSYTESILHISISGLTADQAAANYGFSEKQKEVLTELLSERELLLELIGDLHGEIYDVKQVLKALPDDLSPERRAIVETACSLVGKVNYFWGGKSLVNGWDTRWGMLKKVWADGSSTTGTYRPYGLDCSGFVDWVFYNATNGEYYPGQGGGAADQHANSTPITWESAQPGDLVFYPGDEHVGIVAGFDETGEILIIHCASGYNNVVITGIEGFVTIAKPATCA